MQLAELVGDAPVRLLTAPSYEWAIPYPSQRFFDTSPLTPRDMLRGTVIVHYSPESLDYHPIGEPTRTPRYQGQIYYATKLTIGPGFNAVDSRDVLPDVIANARWGHSKAGGHGAVFTTAERWSRAYVVERAARMPDCPRAKELLDLPPNWAFRMGVRPLLLDGVNRERVLALEVEEEDLPQPDELPPLVRGIVETALSRAGYTVASVSLPDAVYAIGDPARSGYLKIGCGTAGDRRPDSELGCQSRLDEAKRWTAGQAYFAVPPFQVGAGLGEAAEAFIHAELRGRGRHVDGEWFRASAGEVKDLVVRFLGSLSRRC